jgi:hypothetical protein
MATKTKRPQKPAKACFFCGQLGDMTKEHVWAQWLGKDAEVDDSQVTTSSGFRRTGDFEMTESPNLRSLRRATVLAAQVREVCGTCNNGWMSRLEQAAEPLLRRLWAPSYSLGFTAFSIDSQRTIATWATKTAWIREFITRSTTATSEMRLDLMTQLHPPALTTVWAARYSGERNFSSLIEQIGVHHQDKHWTEETREVMIVELIFNGICLLVRTDSGPGIPPVWLPPERWLQIWPASGTAIWPPRSPVEDTELNALLHRPTTWLNMPAVTTFVRSPGFDN